jgi:uroporphyrinogen decarboxylase
MIYEIGMDSKKERMADQERLDALFNYRKPDRVPIGSQWMSIGFNTVNVGGTITEAYDDPEKSFNAFLKTTEQYGWDHIFQCFRHTVSGAQDFGGKVRLPRGEYESALIVVSHPVTTEKEIENLQMPDPKTAGGIPKAMEFAELQEASGFPVSFCSRSPFTLAANICGLELFLKWLIKKPQLCEYLIQIALDHIINVLSNWAERFGSDRLFVWMSSPSESNQVISPKHFQKYALPYHMTYHERLKSLGIKSFGFHVCGDQNLNMPYLADASPWINPSVLSFGHEVDIDAAAKHFQRDIIFGNINPVVLQYGSPEQIYELSRAAIAKGKRAPGGFVLAPGCDIPVMTPSGNLHAMTKAINDYGWYE